MAEPVITKDIEDVVSSVRRLVAPEASPRPQSRDLGHDRLLLTPALRAVADVGDASLPEVEVAVELPPHPDLADGVVPVQAPSDTRLHLVVHDHADIAGPDGKGAAEGPVTSAADLTVPLSEVVPETGDETVLQFPQAYEPRVAWAGAGDGTALPGLTDVTEPLSGLTDADGNPVTVIDEAALNDIVRALIREELQGILGERITQNVRKLVRAEINRALTARTLD